ncbi:MAG: PrsW family intramembrane metalloprotease [Ignavibacteria bacterium]|nr:PrsW family intramembrane metalloprotease [Ignavibacteria bacterium]
MIDIFAMVLTGGGISALFFKFYSGFERYRYRGEIDFLLPALAGGLVAVLFTIGIQFGMSQIYEVADIMYRGHFRSIYVSPLIEEIAKGGVTLLAIRLLKSEELLDSLFLAIAIGLGFAFFENILYSSIGNGERSMAGTMLERTLVIAPMHSVQNFLFILLYLFISNKIENRFLVFLLAAPFPAVSHSIWNYIALETGANIINLTLMIIVSRSIVYAVRVEKEHFIEVRVSELTDNEGESEEGRLLMMKNGWKEKGEEFIKIQIESSKFIYNSVLKKFSKKRIS